MSGMTSNSCQPLFATETLMHHNRHLLDDHLTPRVFRVGAVTFTIYARDWDTVFEYIKCVMPRYEFTLRDFYRHLYGLGIDCMFKAPRAFTALLSASTQYYVNGQRVWRPTEHNCSVDIDYVREALNCTCSFYIKHGRKKNNEVDCSKLPILATPLSINAAYNINDISAVTLMNICGYKRIGSLVQTVYVNQRYYDVVLDGFRCMLLHYAKSVRSHMFTVSAPRLVDKIMDVDLDERLRHQLILVFAALLRELTNEVFYTSSRIKYRFNKHDLTCNHENEKLFRGALREFINLFSSKNLIF